MNLENIVRATIDRVGKTLVLAAPLGIGKPNPVLNAFYRYAAEHPQIRLSIFTALSLAVPEPGKGLQARFLGPFLDRHFGTGYPRLAYLDDLQRGRLPANITVHEFYLQSGSLLGSDLAQQSYISSNYTHVARDMDHTGVNVICQMVAANGDQEHPRYSLSCNPDVTLDLMDRLQARRDRVVTIAMANPGLPYMGGDAEVGAEFFDHIIDDPALYHKPFAVPRTPVSLPEHMIGLYASTLIRDGGTLQIGIGALGDAICHAAIRRHQEPGRYRALADAFGIPQRYGRLLEHDGGLEPFQTGLYAASEMFMDGFLRLYDAGILKRRVYDDAGLQTVLNSFDGPCPDTGRLLQALAARGVIRHELKPYDLDWLTYWGLLSGQVTLRDGRLHLGGESTPAMIDGERGFDRRIKPFLGPGLRHGKLLHAAFFLGSAWFYEKLHGMPEAERARFMMTRVSRINQLYHGEELDRAQRHRARFINTCMKMTLLGAAVSDQLADARVVSGVGGQYNFVAMAHALETARSVLMLRSTRRSGKGLESNIVWEYPQQTIPRHLRDIVITEYGIADLRGQPDAECIRRMLNIADSRFQDDLRQQAAAAGKLSADWKIPEHCRRNTPEALQQILARHNIEPPPRWPFGSDLDTVEQQLAKALRWLQSQPRWRLALLLAQPLSGATHPEALERMRLGRPAGLVERAHKRLLMQALRRV